MKLKEIWKTHKKDYWIANGCLVLGAGLLTARFGLPIYALPFMAGAGMIFTFVMMTGLSYYIGDKE